MTIDRTPGMTLKEYIKIHNATQVTVQHAENDKVTYIKGFKESAGYELQEGQTIWYRKDNKLIKNVYRKPTIAQRITRMISPKRKMK